MKPGCAVCVDGCGVQCVCVDGYGWGVLCMCV